MAHTISSLFLFLSILLPLALLSFIFTQRKKKKLKNKGNVVLICFVLFIINFSISKFIDFKHPTKEETLKIEDASKESDSVSIESVTLESNNSIVSSESKIESENSVMKDSSIKNESTTKSRAAEQNTNSKKSSTKASNSSSEETKEVVSEKTTQKVEETNGVTYVSGYMIVNKTYSLPRDYVPTNTHKSVDSSTTICAECINEEAYQAFTKMKTDAKNLGLSIWIQSGYRSYSYQQGLYNSYVKREGQTAADTYSARAGHSEHQTGLAFDLNSVSDAFATTKEGIWVNDNCYKYGFILRYPKGKDAETGYKYESWHLRYVGTDLASKLYNNGDWITMESYFGLTSTYAS